MGGGSRAAAGLGCDRRSWGGGNGHCSLLVETRRCETGWHAALKGELVTAGLRAPLCQVRGGGGQDFTLKQCFVNNVHKADALYPAPRLQKKPQTNGALLSSRYFCSAESARSEMGACVGAVPGAGTSWPPLLQAPCAFASPPALGMCWHRHIPSLGSNACLASKDSADSI